MGRKSREGANLNAVFGKNVPGRPRSSHLEGRFKRYVFGEISIFFYSPTSNS